MDNMILIDVRYSESFVDGTRMIQDIFSAAHRLSGTSLYGVDFPGQADTNTVYAHMTAVGHQVRLFGEKDHLSRVRDSLNHKYGELLFFPEGSDLLRTGDVPIIGYAQVLSKRPRKSAAQAANRLRCHLEKREVALTHEITEGSQNYAAPDGAYITYESLSTGKRFPIWVRRKRVSIQNVANDFHTFDRFGLSKGGWLPVYEPNN